MRGARERLVHDRLVADLPIEALVAGHVVVDEGGAGLHRVEHGGDAGQVLVLNVDELGGVARLLPRVGDDDGELVAHVPHLADGEDRVGRLDLGRAVLVLDDPAAGEGADAVGLHVGAREHGDDAGC